MSSRVEIAANGPHGGIRPAPYTGRFITADGLRLHYLDYGGAGRAPMLCVHGGAAHAHWFDYAAGSFTPHYHVRSLDLRGHGDSDWVEPAAYCYGDYASDIHAAVEALDLREFVLVGHSMGGMVSLLYAATYPGRVAKLVVADSSLRLSDERMATLRAVGSRPGTSYATQEDLVANYRLRPGQSVAGPEVVRHIATHGSRRLADGSWKLKFDRRVYATRDSLDGRQCWNRIGIPALLVKCEHSTRVTPEVYADAKARCPQLELAVVPESGHHVMLDNPAGFVAVVRQFLDGTAPAGA